MRFHDYRVAPANGTSHIYISHHISDQYRLIQSFSIMETGKKEWISPYIDDNKY